MQEGPVSAPKNAAAKSNNGKKPYKRVLTPARKAQNRAAQRAYRQRQKELQQQQQQLNKRGAGKADSNYLKIRPRPTLAGRGSESAAANTGYIQSNANVQPFTLSLESLAAELGCSQDEVLQMAGQQHPDTGQSFTDDFFWRVSSIPLDIVDNVYMGKPDTSMLSLGLPESSRSVTQNTVGSTTQLSWDPGRSDPHYAPALQHQHEIGPTELKELLSRNSKFLLNADPYANNLELSQVSLLRICLANARCLGFDVEALFGPDCKSLCSPFYRPITTAEDDPKALLAAASNPSFPAHLQPTLPQILFPHHIMLDLIPFPGLRARAITLAATSPPLLGPFELKFDIICGGLICWGTKKNPGGQPWDMRSWEAAPWFLKKWRLLLDGKDGEITRQSIWWRRMRGDFSED